MKQRHHTEPRVGKMGALPARVGGLQARGGKLASRKNAPNRVAVFQICRKTLIGHADAWGTLDITVAAKLSRGTLFHRD